jgi:diguanylate cyclase (GGDEF)-like protein
VAEAGLRAVAGRGAEAGQAGPAAVVTIAFLLPLNLAGFSLMGQQGTWLRRGGIGLGAIGAQALLVALLAWAAPGATVAVLQYRFERIPIGAGTTLGHMPLLAFGLAFLFFIILAVVGRRATDHGFLWALVAAFLGLQEVGGPRETVYLAAGGLVLAVSVIEASFRLAYHDELTGLASRRALNEALLKLGERYAVAMVDVDHFKKFNDRFGHEVGDQVLRMVAGRLEKVGGGGKAYRYGGEEFCVLFRGAGAEEALPHLEAVRQRIEQAKFRLRAVDRPKQKPKKPRGGAGREVSVTVSIGVAQPARGKTTPEEVIKAADKALYRAKEEGRNRVKKFSYLW